MVSKRERYHTTEQRRKILEAFKTAASSNLLIEKKYYNRQNAWAEVHATCLVTGLRAEIYRWSGQVYITDKYDSGLRLSDLKAL